MSFPQSSAPDNAVRVLLDKTGAGQRESPWQTLGTAKRRVHSVFASDQYDGGPVQKIHGDA